jgi:SAM-dependent methyltransferase
MTMIDQQRGSREVQEELWRARDYAELGEGQNRLDYKEGLRRTGIAPGSVVLDLGCGPGGFCHLAADAGAKVTGLDASPAMIEVARERVPGGRFDVGDMQLLPYEERGFDVVTAFNSLQFTADPGAALAEVQRVAKPDATVFIVVFGREERVELAAKWRALAPLLPPKPPGSPGPLALSKPGLLDDLVQSSGLAVTEAGYLEGAFEFPDQATMLRGQRSSLVAVLAERAVGEEPVTDAIVNAFAPYRTSSGGYRFEIEWRYATATASTTFTSA